MSLVYVEKRKDKMADKSARRRCLSYSLCSGADILFLGGVGGACFCTLNFTFIGSQKQCSL